MVPSLEGAPGPCYLWRVAEVPPESASRRIFLGRASRVCAWGLGVGWAIVSGRVLYGARPTAPEIAVPDEVIRTAGRHGVPYAGLWVLPTAPVPTVLSLRCPHLGCGVVPTAGEGGGFVCPCHRSRFGPGGERLAGPSPTGLLGLPVRREGGQWLVQLPEEGP